MNNKHCFGILVILICLLSGCETTKHGFIKTISRNPSLSPAEADKKFGTPTDIRFLNRDTHFRVYKIYEDSLGFSLPDYIAVYFINNKFAGYGENNDFYHLSMLKRLNLISEGDYEKLYNQAVQEANARRQQLIPLLGAIQNMQMQQQNQQFQQQYLDNQQKMIELQKRSLNNQGTSSETKIIGPKRTDCYTDNFGNIHCTTQ